MAVLNIYNDIQSEQEKAVTRMWGMEPGISFRDINEFCDTIPAEDNIIDVHIHCNGGDVLTSPMYLRSTPSSHRT